MPLNKLLEGTFCALKLGGRTDGSTQGLPGPLGSRSPGDFRSRGELGQLSAPGGQAANGALSRPELTVRQDPWGPNCNGSMGRILLRK